MKTKFSFKTHLMNRLATYVIFLILIPVLSYYIIELKTSPKNYEKFSVFVAAKLNENKDLKADLKELLPEDLKIIVESHTTNEELYQTYVDTVARVSDVVIFPASYVEKIENFSFRNFEEGNPYYSDTNFVKYEKHWALSVTDSGLKDYINFGDEQFYLLIGKKSVHTLNVFDDGKTDQIDRLLKNFNI